MGIVLAVCGAGLYFMRSFKPALARDYDVFFAAIGLLCGGILFFQGWRLDPILQFGQFLLAGTTVFFAYESVRLRGIATDQARRSSYFDEEEPPARMPSGGLRGGWDDSFDQFEEAPRMRRKFAGGDNAVDEMQEGDLYRPRRTSRAAIPEQAASRRVRNSIDAAPPAASAEQARRMARFGRQEEDAGLQTEFGARRSLRRDQRRGTRPEANQQQSSSPRRSPDRDSRPSNSSRYSSSSRTGIPKGSPMGDRKPEDAAFSPSQSSRSIRSKGLNMRSSDQGSGRASGSFQKPSSRPSARPRDNRSRFDD